MGALIRPGAGKLVTAIVGVVSCLSIGALVPPVARADERARTVTHEYSGNGGQWDEARCGGSIGNGAGLEGLRIEIQTLAGETSVGLEVVDDVGGDKIITLVHQAKQPWRVICGRTEYPLPIRADRPLELYLLSGRSDQGPSLVAHGRVTATFYTPGGEPAPGTEPAPEPTAEPSPLPSAGEPVGRSIDGFTLRKHLVAEGLVSSSSDDATCEGGVPVVLERGSADGWKPLKTVTTGSDGTFAIRVEDRPGRYRVVASEAPVDGRSCSAAVSRARRHSHQ